MSKAKTIKDIRELLLKKRRELYEIRTVRGMWMHREPPEFYTNRVIGELHVVLSDYFGPDSSQFAVFKQATSASQVEGVLDAIINQLDASCRASVYELTSPIYWAGRFLGWWPVSTTISCIKRHRLLSVIITLITLAGAIIAILQYSFG